MKKTILAIVAAMTMSTSVMAQENNQRRNFDPAAMAKQRTEMMAKEYGLDEKQSKELLTLNTEFAGKMPMMGRGNRGGGRPGDRMRGNGPRPEHRDSMSRGGGNRQGGNRQGFGGNRMSREEMEKAMKEYDEGLKKIMTDDQYKKYKADEEKRRSEMRNRQGGERRQR